MKNSILSRFRFIFILSAALGILLLFLAAFFLPDIKSGVKTYLRHLLFLEFRPVALENCEFKRYGERNDGGYVMCSNLLDQAEAVYSYGIEGRDEWGCEISGATGLSVHQYDCFDHRRPECPGLSQEKFIFHEECIEGFRQIKEGRSYDTLQSHLKQNGDSEKNIILKMDVEGSEWEVLKNTQDDTFARIDQLTLEFHKVDKNLFQKLLLIRRLKNYFYIVNIHFNNHACVSDMQPFPAWAFQAHLVNKRIGKPASADLPALKSNPMNAPDAPGLPDCQAKW